MPIVEPMTFRELKPEDVNPLSDLVNKGLQSFEFGQKAYFEPQKSAADILAQQLANRINQPKAENAEAITQADLQKEQLGNVSQQIKNKYLDAAQQADLNKTKAMVNYYNNGGFGGGTGKKEELFFQSLVAKDNPQLGNDPAKIYEAANTLRAGGNTLSDGTKLNPLSSASQQSFGRLTKGTTYAGAAVPLIKANQAEAEIPVFQKYIAQGIKPYGDTYFNKSPTQILDTFKTDDVSQQKLGDLIAADSLAYELSQVQIRLAAGQTGEQATAGLMDRAKNHIDSRWPRLSYKARVRAMETIGKALKEGLAARKSAGVDVTSILPNSGSRATPTGSVSAKWVRQNGQLVRAQ